MFVNWLIFQYYICTTRLMVRGNYLVKYEKKDNPFIQKKKKSDAVSEIP